MPKRLRASSFEQGELGSHEQLEVLYEISKAIAGFVSIEESFPALLDLAAHVLPLRTSVMVESRGATTTATVWRKGEATPGEVTEAVALGKLLYAQLIGPRPLQIVPRLEGVEFIALPLVVSGRPPFGVLLLQGGPEVTGTSLPFADALTKLIAVAVDRYYALQSVAELREKHIVELEEERDLREAFVSILSHDLRNPLGVAKMSAEFIFLKFEKPEICRDRARQIMASIDRVDHMIQNLLDVNRLRAGQALALKFEEFELRQLLSATVEELSVVYGDRLVFADGREVRGYWSRGELRRAIENLITNAIKYGLPEGPVTVSLRSDAGTVQIAVHNEGEPIPPADIAQLFQRFRRSKAAQSSTIRGWGLGLPLVLGMAEAHGGTVKVDSAPGRGTTFTLELPRDARPI